MKTFASMRVGATFGTVIVGLAVAFSSMLAQAGDYGFDWLHRRRRYQRDLSNETATAYTGFFNTV